VICFLTPSGVVGLQIFGQLNILFSGASKDFSTSGTEILFIQVCFEQIQIKWKQMVLNDTHKECRKKKTTSKATNKNILYQKGLFKTVDTDKYKNEIFPMGLCNYDFCNWPVRDLQTEMMVRALDGPWRSVDSFPQFQFKIRSYAAAI